MIGTVNHPFPSKEPTDVAAALIPDFFSPNLKCPGLLYTRKSFIQWLDGRWVRRDEEQVFHSLLLRLRNTLYEQVIDGRPNMKPLRISNLFLTNVLTSLKALCSRDIPRFPFWAGNPADTPDTLWTIPFSDVLVTINPDGTLTTRPRDERWVDVVTLPVPFEPNATCPVWDRVLEETSQGEAAWKDLLQMWTGAILVPYSSFRRWLLKYGVIAGSKGVHDRLCQKLLGDDGYVSTSLSVMSTDFGLEGATHARLTIVSEGEDLTKASGAKAVSIMKNAMGDDKGSVNVKGKAIERNVRLHTKLMMSANHLPLLPDSKGGLSAKMLLLPYRVSFEGRRDYSLEDKLERELSGIAQWALRGAITVRTQAATGEIKWPEPMNAQAERKRYRLRNYPMESFVEDTFMPNVGNPVASWYIWDLWNKWKAANQVNRHVGRNELLNAMIDGCSWNLELGLITNPSTPDRPSSQVRALIGLSPRIRTEEH